MWWFSSAMMATAAPAVAFKCGGDRGRGGELLGAQSRLDFERSGIEVASSPSGFDYQSDLRHAQSSSIGRGGRTTQDG